MFEFYQKRSLHLQGSLLLKQLFEIIDKHNLIVSIRWAPRIRASIMSADAASRCQPWFITEAFFQQILQFFKLSELQQTPFLAPIDLLTLSEGSLPKNIDQFFHSQTPVFLFVTPDLPHSVYDTIFKCFQKFPVRILMILPALHFTQWFQKYAKYFTHFFDVPISSKFFITQRNTTTYNFDMRITLFYV